VGVGLRGSVVCWSDVGFRRMKDDDPGSLCNRTDILEYAGFPSRCQARLCSRGKGPTAPIPSKARRFIPGRHHRGFPARFSVTSH
jgi:hypothetical protein